MAVVRRIPKALGDPLLAGLVILLALFGVAMIYSAGQLDVPGGFVTGAWRLQLQWLVISLVAFAAAMRIQARWFEWLAVPAYALGVLLLILTLFIGTGFGTAASVKSWIQVGPLLFQPSQFALLATVLMLARMLGDWREPPTALVALWKPIAVALVPAGLVFVQPDLGTALMFGALLLAALYWAGTPLSLICLMLSPLVGLIVAFQDWMFSVYMVILLVFLYVIRMYFWEAVLVVGANLAVGTLALPLWNSLKPYQQSRVRVFFDPMVDPTGAGWQVIQSRVAIGSGGLFGKGFTLGTQKRLAFLPEQHTDFIFSVVGEELGFLGTTAVLAVFGLILWRLVRISERAADPFAGIAVFGIFGIWFAHVMINIGMTVGVLPITGSPLPFLSYGGSFLLTSFLALSIVLRMAAEQRKT